MRLSFKDKELLSLLRENGRASTTDIAKTLGLSRSTVQKRFDRLVETGVIEGFTVRLNPEFLDQIVKAHVNVTVSPRQTCLLYTSDAADD